MKGIGDYVLTNAKRIDEDTWEYELRPYNIEQLKDTEGLNVLILYGLSRILSDIIVIIQKYNAKKMYNTKEFERRYVTKNDIISDLNNWMLEDWFIAGYYKKNNISFKGSLDGEIKISHKSNTQKDVEELMKEIIAEVLKI